MVLMRTGHVLLLVSGGVDMIVTGIKFPPVQFILTAIELIRRAINYDDNKYSCLLVTVLVIELTCSVRVVHVPHQSY